MPGAQITEQVDDTHFKGTVKSKIGPAVMSFGGEIEVQGIDPAAKSLQLMAKGADKSGSSAAMQLTAHLEAGDAAGTTTLVGVATITVSGKLAQFGSRLLVPVSDAMLAQFADNFRNAAAAVPLVAPADPGAVAAPEAAAASATAAPGASPTAPAAAAPVKELNALVLMWTVFRNWLAQLFGGKA
jgi:carbon monoxide dehydrogenase subunit G